MEEHHAKALEYKQDKIAALLAPRFQMVLNLMGLSVDPLILTGRVMEETDSLEEAIGCKNATQILMIQQCRVELAFIMRDFRQARSAAKQAMVHGKDCIDNYAQSVLYFFDTLILLDIARENASKRKKYRQMARQNLKRLKKLSVHAPENFANKLQLIDAEMLAFDGKIDQALNYYDSAIRTAGKEGFLHEKAIACERCAVSLGFAGKEVESNDYMDQSLEHYQVWGAQIKLSQISKKNVQNRTASTDASTTLYSGAS